MDSWKKTILRAAGFGGGFAIVAAVIIGVAIWWSSRPPQWSSSAITAKPTELILQQVDEDLHFRIRYSLTNNTNAEYTLPAPDKGALMRRLPKDYSLDKLDGTSWDSTVRIPPKQTISYVFDVAYKFADFNLSAAQVQDEKELVKFAGARLNKIDGFVFFDYGSRYQIDMPKNWDSPKTEAKKRNAKLMAPDTGDIFDKIDACQKVADLLQKCKAANIPIDTGTFSKFGGYPVPLKALPTADDFAPGPSAENCGIAGEWQNYCKAKVK